MQNSHQIDTNGPIWLSNLGHMTHLATINNYISSLLLDPWLNICLVHSNKNTISLLSKWWYPDLETMCIVISYIPLYFK